MQRDFTGLSHGVMLNISTTLRAEIRMRNRGCFRAVIQNLDMEFAEIMRNSVQGLSGTPNYTTTERDRRSEARAKVFQVWEYRAHCPVLSTAAN